jgi:AcrR family transcriptional regulator
MDAGSGHVARRPVARRRRLSADERRERILRAAEEVFAERGYQGASVTEIARRAGVVASVLYDHFPSKKELHIELLHRHTEALIARAASPVATSSAEELMRHSLERFFEFVEEHPFAARLLFRDPPTDPDVAAAQRQSQDRATQAIATLVGSFQPQAELLPALDRRTADQLLAEGIKSAVNGLAGWWYEHPEIPRSTIVTAAWTLLWSGLERLEWLSRS